MTSPARTLYSQNLKYRAVTYAAATVFTVVFLVVNEMDILGIKIRYLLISLQQELFFLQQSFVFTSRTINAYPHAKTNFKRKTFLYQHFQ